MANIKKTTAVSGAKTGVAAILAAGVVEILGIYVPELATPTMGLFFTVLFRTIMTWLKHK